MGIIVHTKNFGECILELGQYQGEKWYEVYVPGPTEEEPNEYIGDVDYNCDLDAVVAAIDSSLY